MSRGEVGFGQASPQGDPPTPPLCGFHAFAIIAAWSDNA
jgi:hypothetical protein